MGDYKLFSKVKSGGNYKLFSDVESSSPKIQEVICMDCGFRMESADNTLSIICPKCGGKRFNCVREVFSPEQAQTGVPVETEGARDHSGSCEVKEEEPRRSLFSETEESYQRHFSQTSDPLELKLKEFSGKILNSEEFEKNFSDTCSLSELEERGYCSISENGDVSIDKDAFIRSRLFSKISITITRELDLNPEITCCHDPFKEAMINGFAQEDRFSPKCIMIMKKGHGISLAPEHESWMNDSKICEDLRSEFGGERKEKPEFEKEINERYPDAPEEIIQLLKDKGIIKDVDGKIEITKVN